MNTNNPYTRPGCLKVDSIFKAKGAVCPFIEGGPFDNIEQMLATFDKPEELFIVTYAPGNEAIGHKRDYDWIEMKRKLTDQFIAKTGKQYGELTLADAKWVGEQVEQAIREMN